MPCRHPWYSTAAVEVCDYYTEWVEVTECWYADPENPSMDVTCTSYSFPVNYEVCFDDGTGDWDNGGGGYTDPCQDPANFSLPECGGDPCGSCNEPQPQPEDNNYPDLDKIYENLTNPCLENTLSFISSNDFNNNIGEILHTCFGASSNLNITFNQTDALNGSTDGKATQAPSPTGVININVDLNINTLPGAATEFVAKTMYHETLHGYLISTGYIGQLNHHNYIADNYASMLASALLQAYPNLDPLDAKAMAWQGLEGTSAYDSIKVNHPAEYKDMQVRASMFRAGTRGTPCN